MQNEIIRQGVVWYGPKICERIMDAANKLASQTGADSFTASVGSIEWGALKEEMGCLWPDMTPQSVQCIRVGASAGTVECVLDPKCKGVHVEPKRAPSFESHPTRHLQLFDDEQLRAECKRRGLDVYDPPPALLEILDALLPGPTKVFPWTTVKARVDELLALEKMVKSPKTVIMTNLEIPEGLEAGRIFSTPRPIRVVVESHVRPLRIPNADAFQFVCPDGTIGAPNPPTEKGAPKTLSIKEANQLMSEAAANMRRDIESLSDPVLRDGREMGIGIASIPKPDNSHYVLDVDLLADDAG